MSTVPAVDEAFYSRLTPGIRDLVKELREARFDTCDSGDGVTNVEMGMEGAQEERHIYMMVTLDNMVEETKRLAKLYPDAWVEMSWCPTQEPILMILPDGLVVPPGVGVREVEDETDEVVLTPEEEALVELYREES